MTPAFSTHVFLQQRLHPGLLDTLQRAGAASIEVFASRHHFDYTDRGAVLEIANWFRANPVAATLHMPLFTIEEESQWSRHTAASLNLIDRDKGLRIAAMDEVKRALEAAEQVPFRACVVHLGLKDDVWDTRALDDSLTAIEHLKAFASPLGVKLLLENLPNAVATPAHLVEIARVGHFSGVGFCLDTGHAHLAETSPEFRGEHGAQLVEQFGPGALKDGVAEAFMLFGDKLAELHLHDNGGTRDEHCWPGEGTLPWDIVRAHAAKLGPDVIAVLEIAHELGSDSRLLVEKAHTAWQFLNAASESR